MLELPDDATKARLASDPFYRLEETTGRRLRVLDATDQVEQLMSMSKARGADGNDMKLNRQLKQGVRARRAADHACEARCDQRNVRQPRVVSAGVLAAVREGFWTRRTCWLTLVEGGNDATTALMYRRKELGLPDHLKLLPETEADVAAASKAFAAHRTRSASRQADRSSILAQDIFSGSTGRSRSSTAHSRKRSQSQSSAREAVAASTRPSAQQHAGRKRCKHDQMRARTGTADARVEAVATHHSSKSGRSVSEVRQKTPHSEQADAG